MSNQDETSETLYLATQALNPSQTNGNSVICEIDIQSNPIVKDLSEWNIYLQSITTTTSEVPYFNAKRNLYPNQVARPAAMNFSITFFDTRFPNNNDTFVIGAGDTKAIGLGLNAGNAYQDFTLFFET